MAASPMARARLGLVGAGCALLMLGPLIADAQQSVSDLLGRPATAEGQPKSYLEELSLFGYVENSFVWNTGTTGRGDVNELRFYDHDNGYTFNAAELSVKKDPSPRYRLGYGVVVTAGLDSQKNHSLGSSAPPTIRARSSATPRRSTCPRRTPPISSRWVRDSPSRQASGPLSSG